MHDILVGCLQYEIKELIEYLVLDLKLISLDVLNQKTFSYVYTDTPNKPVQISSTSLNSTDHSLKQTGTLCYLCIVAIVMLGILSSSMQQPNYGV